MKITKKILSMILAFVMVLGLLLASAIAAEGEYVYLSISYDGKYIDDKNSNAQITFPNAGTYYVWCDGGMGVDDGTHGSCAHYREYYEPCIVSSPAYAKVTVTGAQVPE